LESRAFIDRHIQAVLSFYFSYYIHLSYAFTMDDPKDNYVLYMNNAQEMLDIADENFSNQRYRTASRCCYRSRKSAGICRGSKEMAAKTRPALKLSLKEKKAVREFITTVHLAYGEKIQRAALFGSKVRGDWTKYSDVDILLIVADDKWKFRQPFSVIISDIALKYDVELDVRVISAERWQYMANIQAGLYQNISQDAVPIRFRKITPAST
jgi:predicted nucleotidyltransferase